ncbi:phage integrase [Halomonas sp. PBN3]|uniref:phage integrase n=1 Tax=Halomonas sp. PBN3 TaxID=1397528 RepID=UPI0003B88A92|nr:tyrosine-type recombinase/integrase [Halomonas sp. PBN3]ERS91939.1 recombinase [Halomonas sp. PBN3]
MTIRKVKTGWQVDIQPGGRGSRRIRKTFKTQAEAKRFERHVQGKASAGHDYAPPKRDTRTLRDLVDLWHAHHGHTLKSGPDRLRSLRNLCAALDNPQADAFTAQDWAEYRTRRLQEVKPSSVNHEHAYLKAVFSELQRLDLWQGPNPLANVRKIRTDETEMAFLTLDQVRLLLAHLKAKPNRDCYFITLLCLSTGARWSEAQTLRAEQLGKYRVTFVATKSGKTRTVPLDARLVGQLRHRRPLGRLFVNAYKAFQTAIQDLGFQLPRGQLTHVLRHTFASHFMMNGGNILVLQRILGHQSITMTMRYAHFAPDHLEEAVKLNPVAHLGRHNVDTHKKTASEGG